MLEYWVSKNQKVVLLAQERFAKARGKEFLAFSSKSAGGGRSSNLFQGNTYPWTHHSAFRYSNILAELKVA